MLGFIKIIFIGLLSFGGLLVSDGAKCVFLNNQLCQARPTLINTNSNKRLYYSFSVSVNKCAGICNTTDDPYAPNACSRYSKKYECKSTSFNVKGK